MELSRGPVPFPQAGDEQAVDAGRDNGEGDDLIGRDAFAVEPGMRPDAVRLCLSHEPDENRLMQGLQTLGTILTESPSASSLVL